jgi:hypothetical protein
LVYELAQEARKLTAQGFSIIPLMDKVAVIKYEHRRKQLATTRDTSSAILAEILVY